MAFLTFLLYRRRLYSVGYGDLDLILLYNTLFFFFFFSDAFPLPLSFLPLRCFNRCILEETFMKRIGGVDRFVERRIILYVL